MIHEANRALERAWLAAAEGRDRPSSGSAPDLWAHALIARRWDADHYVFVHAGDGLTQSHGRSLIDQNLLSLWRRDDRRELRDALEEAVRLSLPLIVRGRGRRLDGGSIEFEATFWPLVGPGGAVDRLLGAIAPCVGASCGRPVIEHAIDEIALLPRALEERAPNARDLTALLVGDLRRARAGETEDAAAGAFKEGEA